MLFFFNLNSFKQSVRARIPTKYLLAVDNIYYMLLPLRSILYIGNRVNCPCCNSYFSKFAPAKPGAKILLNQKCPKCDSWKRHRLLWLYLKNKTNIFSEQLKVLHLAPEYSLQKELKNMSNLDYISADLLSPTAMVKMDVTNIPYEDNYFDVIICNHVLEHIMDDRKAMKELLRVLKPNGWAILQVPIDLQRDKTFEDPTIVSPKERERLFWQHDHVRLYGLDYKDRLEEVGFNVKVDDYVRELGSEAIEKYGLNSKEDIYFCTKKL